MNPVTAYDAAKTHAAWVDRSSRVRLNVSGADRARFLHNLVTNEVKRLPVGDGCEAFVTSLQGKTLGYVTLHVGPNEIMLRADPDSLASLMPHLSKYGAIDDVAFEDISSTTFELHVAGSRAGELLVPLGCALPGPAEQSHVETAVVAIPVRLIRESPTGFPGYTLIGKLADREPVIAALQQAGGAIGFLALSDEDFDVLRIEAGTPVFGRDITAENLPQEVGRDTQAINFVKGCYLGQETVARLDALGHVNKILKGLQLSPGDPVPPVGTPLLCEADGKPAGTVTSSALSPGWKAPVLLGYVRVAHATAGTPLGLELEGQKRTAIVSDLPMQPPFGT